MSVDVLPNLVYNPVNSVYRPTVNYNPYSVSTTCPLAPLEQDCFVKSVAPCEENIDNEDEVLLYKQYLGSTVPQSVSSLQTELRDKQRKLEYNKRMLRDYPDNPKYGREIDKLEREIQDLKRQISKLW